MSQQDIGRVLREAMRRKFPGMIEAEEAAIAAVSPVVLSAQRDELRAILAPLLDEPYDDYDAECWCRFCGEAHTPERLRQEYVRKTEGVPVGETHYDIVKTVVPAVCVHKSDCPVLDRGRLLGRVE